MTKENLKLSQVKQHWEKKYKEHQKKAAIQFGLFLTLLILLMVSINKQIENTLATINNPQLSTSILLIISTLITIYIANKVLQSAYKHLDKKETAHTKITTLLSYLALKENHQAINDKQLTQEFEKTISKI